MNDFLEQIEGDIEAVVFRNEDTGFTVLEVRAGRRLETIVGVMSEVSVGERYRFWGKITTHRDYGEQMRAERIEAVMPDTLEGMLRYLSSGLISGVGRVTAKNIILTFGENALTVLATQPHRLVEVPGIGQARAQTIAQAFAKQAESREVMLFLQSNGLTLAQSTRIHKMYGARTVDIVKDNPYRLIEDIQGIGFKIADALAVSMGMQRTDSFRVRAGIQYTLQLSLGNGHTFLPLDELLPFASRLLALPEETILNEMYALATAYTIKQEVIEGRHRVYLYSYFQAEKDIATKLLALDAATNAWGTMQEVEDYQQMAGIQFAPLQQQAILGALEHPVFIITGGPGTGKTTIINCIITLLEQQGKKALLAAPTGRAAKRMTEATGREAKTIHRMLEYGYSEDEFSQFQKNEDNPLVCDALILDEVSMLDVFLMRSVLSALKPGTRLILVGDADQLPSVGAGNVLRDLLKSNLFGCVYLKEIFRQSEASLIITNAHKINRGEMPELGDKEHDFFFERRYAPQDVLNSVLALVSARIPSYFGFDSMRDIQVLTPMRKGALGVYALNAALQKQLNPPAYYKQERAHGETVFREGDRVMQIRNDYTIEWQRDAITGNEEGTGVFNGDIGIIKTINTSEQVMTVLFDDGKMVLYDFTQIESLELAYAISIHKSQGSEFPVVVLPLAGGSPMLFTRNLLYTAVTRAKSLVLLVGREEAVQTMVDNDFIHMRYSALADRLLEFAPYYQKTNPESNGGLE